MDDAKVIFPKLKKVKTVKKVNDNPLLYTDST